MNPKNYWYLISDIENNTQDSWPFHPPLSPVLLTPSKILSINSEDIFSSKLGKSQDSRPWCQMAWPLILLLASRLAIPIPPHHLGVQNPRISVTLHLQRIRRKAPGDANTNIVCIVYSHLIISLRSLSISNRMLCKKAARNLIGTRWEAKNFIFHFWSSTISSVFPVIEFFHASQKDEY